MLEKKSHYETNVLSAEIFYVNKQLFLQRYFCTPGTATSLTAHMQKS